jgi:hypothetical protein
VEAPDERYIAQDLIQVRHQRTLDLKSRTRGPCRCWRAGSPRYLPSGRLSQWTRQKWRVALPVSAGPRLSPSSSAE